MKYKVRIRALTDEAICDFYPIIFKAVFGFFDKYHIPEFVDVATYDNKIIGFVAGELYNKDTWYAQYGGVLKKYRSVGIGSTLWPFYIKRIKEKHNVKFIMMKVKNTNKQALTMFVGYGFVPIGLSVANGETFIQLTKRI